MGLEMILDELETRVANALTFEFVEEIMPCEVLSSKFQM